MLLYSGKSQSGQHLEFPHLVYITAIMAGFDHQQCVSEMVMAVWLGEMSSPFPHLREFLEELGYSDTACNLAADILFAATYSVARFVFGAYVAYVILSANKPPIIKVMGLGLEVASKCVLALEDSKNCEVQIKGEGHKQSMAEKHGRKVVKCDD